MNRLFLLAGALIISGCADRDVKLDLGDIEAYNAFVEEQENKPDLNPFKAEPLRISATGKVRAEPDIAVITATITGEDRNESKAVNAMSAKVNAVQAALSSREIETGFTSVSSNREFDEKCRNTNQIAYWRHREIQQDHNFNRNLDRRGDKDTKRRVPKPRIKERVCEAQSIKVATTMVIRIQPAEAAGDALRALADAGAENSRLFGYDFTDYDSHYQKAAEKAVEMARKKAEAHADLTGTELGEIETFTVTRPDRTGRFGPQPNVIRSANRYRGQQGSVINRQVNRVKVIPAVTKQISRRNVVPPPPPPPQVAYMSCWDGSTVGGGGMCPPEPVAESVYSDYGGYDEIVVTGTRRASSSYSSNAPLRGAAYGGGLADGGYTSGSSNTTNALSMSLLSGPQTIAVTAVLSYAYETPLDGKVIVEREDK